MMLASSFIPGGLSPWMLLWDVQITSPLCAPGALQMAVSRLYVHGFFAYFLSKSRAMSPRLYPSHACWPLKTPRFKTTGFWKSLNLAPLTFQANRYEVSFSLCASLYVSLFLALFRDHGSFPTTAATNHFSTKCLCTSYLFWCGLFFAFSVEFILPVFMLIYAVFRMIW